jgi:hypothetical protein
MHTVTVPNRFGFGCRSIGDSSNKENFVEQKSIYFSLSENLFLAACSGVPLRGGKMIVT